VAAGEIGGGSGVQRGQLIDVVLSGDRESKFHFL
jgi:hypothetical protein